MSQLLTILVSLAAMTLLCAVGAPRLWLCGIAALIMSPVAAFAVSLLGALAGNYALFAACRTKTANRVVDWVFRRRLPSIRRLSLVQTGVFGVILLRQAPGPGAVMTIFLARTDVSACEFLLGSLIGFLPTTFLTVFLTGTAASRLPKEILAWTTAGMALVATTAWFILNRIGKPKGVPLVNRRL